MVFWNRSSGSPVSSFQSAALMIVSLTSYGDEAKQKLKLWNGFEEVFVELLDSVRSKTPGNVFDVR